MNKRHKPFSAALVSHDIIQYTLVVNDKDTYALPSFDDAQGTQTSFVATIMIADEITSMRVIPVMSKGGANLEESLLLLSSTGDWDAMIHTIAKVRNPKPTERLNLRNAPDIQSEVWMQYYNGAPMEVKNVLPDGWIAVSVGISEGCARGYVKADYLAFGEEAERVAPQMPTRRSVNSFNVYGSPDLSASIISTFPSGTDFTIMGLSKTWWHVRVGDLTGYVSIGTTEGNGAPLATTAPGNNAGLTTPPYYTENNLLYYAKNATTPYGNAVSASVTEYGNKGFDVNVQLTLPDFIPNDVIIGYNLYVNSVFKAFISPQERTEMDSEV